MGRKHWVVNASPLILLGKAGYLRLLEGSVESILIPSAVSREIHVKSEGRDLLEAVNANATYSLLADTTVHDEVLAWGLGAGETQVIALGLEYHAERVVLDDLEARRCAKTMGLTVIGTLGLVARAKRLGHIEEAGPVLRRLCETGLYASEDLIAWILKEVQEG